MIINLRGTSGSGKTYAVRAFMDAYAPAMEIMLTEKKVAANLVFYNMMPVYIIGSYRTVCGGCDTIPTQDMACSLVRHFSRFGHVIFEGLIMSHIFSRYYALYEELTGYGDKFVVAFMDTPLEVSIDHILERRAERGLTKPYEPRRAEGDHKGTMNSRDAFIAKGADVRWFRHKKDPVKQIERLLNEDDALTFETSYREESFK